MSDQYPRPPDPATEPDYHAFADSIDLFVCGLDRAGKIRLFNRLCEELTGIPRGTAVGSSWVDLFASHERPDDVHALWRQAAAAGTAPAYEALCRQDRRLRWHFSRWRRGDADDDGFWAVGIDVTHEHAAHARTRLAEHMLSLGTLSAGLAHEIRNPLNSAALQLAVADRLLGRAGDARLAPIGEAVARASGEIQRVAALLEDFLEFARPQPIAFERVDLREVAARAVARACERASVPVTLVDGPAAIAEVDAGRVEGAIGNLLDNAIDAAARTVAADAGVRVRVLPRPAVVAVEVEDDGPGLPSADAPIFDPFFTTKPGGTGLGLSIVQRVASDHGGAVLAERRGATTIFRLLLPTAASS